MQKLIAANVRGPEGRGNRWAVILAGGDGKRLLPLTRNLTGVNTPKQFCALTGSETLLDQTRRRVAELVPRHQTFLLLNRMHERYYSEHLDCIERSRLLVQPHNHGTAPAIAYSLVRLEAEDPHALVAFFPSDHHFNDDRGFAESLEAAFARSEVDSERVVLLGIAPESPEQSYGWIEPGAALGNSVFEVRRFREKPSCAIAHSLMHRACLWNSFVMVGRVSAFLALVRQTLPDLLDSMETALAEPGSETDSLRKLYEHIPPTNFSEDVLAARPAALTVLRAEGLGWSDLGEPARVFSVINSKRAWPEPVHPFLGGFSEPFANLQLASMAQEAD